MPRITQFIVEALLQLKTRLRITQDAIEVSSRRRTEIYDTQNAIEISSRRLIYLYTTQSCIEVAWHYGSGASNLIVDVSDTMEMRDSLPGTIEIEVDDSFPVVPSLYCANWKDYHGEQPLEADIPETWQ